MDKPFFLLAISSFVVLNLMGSLIVPFGRHYMFNVRDLNIKIQILVLVAWNNCVVMHKAEAAALGPSDSVDDKLW